MSADSSGLFRLIVDWINGQPLLGLLLVLMALDVVMGTLVAATKKQLNSSVSLTGMTRKGGMLLMVGVGAALEPLANGLPLAKFIAMGFVVTEALSLTEGAALLGIPMPPVLLDTLSKLRTQSTTLPSTTVTRVDVHTATTAPVARNPQTRERVSDTLTEK